MEPKDTKPMDESSKLRRWVSNLQLESWQLELLITGFSIFLLVGSIDAYDVFRREFVFNKLRPDAGVINPIVVVAISFVVNSIPLILNFLLINLLVHLLLRGFWIGIVGLSSVSSTIYFDKLNLKGAFRKFIPKKVKSLDELIVYLDKISSVIFAYTYLLVFSILSVVIVTSIIFSLLGLSTWVATLNVNNGLITILSLLIFILIFLVILGAIIFFLDTLLFSAFKKSKWFNVIYFPIYRFFSVVSFSILYRSIYYHLITNFKRKQIVGVALILLVFFFLSQRVSGWDNYKFYPTGDVISEHLMSGNAYDDTRNDTYIGKASIPSKFVDNGYLELFIRYEAADNSLLTFLCPSAQGLSREISISDGFKAGVEVQKDSTVDINELLNQGESYADLVKLSIDCVSELYEIWIDGEKTETDGFMYHSHTNRGEKGYLTVLDIEALSRGHHLLEIRKQTFAGISFMQDITADKISMKTYVRLNFWVQ